MTNKKVEKMKLKTTVKVDQLVFSENLNKVWKTRGSLKRCTWFWLMRAKRRLRGA